MSHWEKIKNLFWYSDSEPTELLISFCYILALPACMIQEFSNPNIIFILGGVLIGSFQLWAVLYNVVTKNCLSYRFLAKKLSSILAVIVVVNLYIEGVMRGTNIEWIIIMLFAFWNTIRLFKEKIERE